MCRAPSLAFSGAQCTWSTRSSARASERASSAAYMGAQVLGGVVAAFTYAAMEHGKTFPLGPGEGYNWVGVAVAEIIYTFVLCFVVLNVATIKSPLTEYFGLAIG